MSHSANTQKQVATLPHVLNPLFSAHSERVPMWLLHQLVEMHVSDKRKLFTVYQTLIHEIMKTSFTTTALIHKNTHAFLTHSHASVIPAVMNGTRSKGAPPQSG